MSNGHVTVRSPAFDFINTATGISDPQLPADKASGIGLSVTVRIISHLQDDVLDIPAAQS